MLFIFLTGILVRASIGTYMLQNMAEEIVGEQLTSSVALVSDEVDRALTLRLQFLQAVAQQSERLDLSSASAWQTYFNSYPFISTLFADGLSIYIKQDDHQLASLLVDVPEQNYRQMDLFAAMQATIVQNKPLLSRVASNDPAGLPHLALSAPIHDEAGKPVGVLLGTVDVLRLDFLSKLQKSSSYHNRYYLLAASASDDISFYLDQQIHRNARDLSPNALFERYRAGYEGYGKVANLEGVESLTAASPVGTTGWSLMIAVPTKGAIVEPVRSFLIRVLIVTVVIMLVAFLVLSWLIRSQLNPLISAAKSVLAWTQSHQYPQPIPIIRHDEIGELVGGFNLLLAKLQRREEKLRLLANVFTFAREGILITDVQGNIIDANEAFAEITGYTRDEVIGCNPKMLSSGRQNKDFYQTMWQRLLDSGFWYGEIWNRRKTGEVYAVMLTISTVRDTQGCVEYYLALFSDITHLKDNEQRLERIAHYDTLTGLPNRVLFADRMQQAMLQAQRSQRLMGVVFIDLDGFKTVNDTYGHEAGDHVLITVAARMSEALREGDTLARLGGDEFVGVLLDLQSPEVCDRILRRLLASASEPVLWHNQLLFVSASIGMTYYPQETDIAADQLMRLADHAMYQAKTAGKNQYVVA